jgi:ribosomal protein S18 acetylase RimI-like enzyme
MTEAVDAGPAAGERPRPALVHGPAAVLEVLERDPHAHVYGIADVHQLWAASRWWRDGPAVAGLLDLPGSPAPVLYAVAVRDPSATLALLERLGPALPDRLVVTGPHGTADVLGRTRAVRWRAAYDKLGLLRPDALPPADPRAVVLGPADLPALSALLASDPASGGFFHPGLLDSGAYLGIAEAGGFVASAGIHVLDPVGGVAAIGNVVVAPHARRRGLGRAVVASLCHHLLGRVPTVGLNVAVGNGPARALYASLGFEVLAPYEEVELDARS